MHDIESVRNSVIACTNCDLSKTRTNAVPGLGKIDTDVIFIGEAPGRNEDIQGAPFVGTAGKILTEALEYAGFVRSDVYITNVVKCRPPDNRRPNIQEIKSCSTYLQRELALIRPRIICILGNTAYGTLLAGSEITKNRGKVIKKDGQLYFVTVHPAAAIYNPSLGQVLKDDLKSMHEILNKIKMGFQIDVEE
ncbi:MAG TPA: uracil-DNA glycosylase [Candidatus Nitrosotalea sp.]|nr:uracil-DNA glycosylase [Candidatus Nitrosotalea sp.]